ncbi:GNAT family N-acetyltransferase [Clostridium tunisiense]|uniref:GNAT family N-acetyltransferase n=1 Tax=Clostridium tunisiense TaxID=219748 RepID=UPI0002F12CFA|nr:GNAT family N-acetyltransferase [Clostridium tunisiense]
MRNIVTQENYFKQLMTEQELIRFSMLYAIGTIKDSFIVTNDKNIVIGQQRLTSPLWIYIKDNLSGDEKDAVVKIICEKLVLNPNLNIDGEEKYLESILEEVSRISGVPFKTSVPKNSYVCHKLIKPELVSGCLSKASDKDLESLTMFSRDNWEELGFGLLTPEQAKKSAQRKLTKPDFHVWRNEEENLVAMASVHKYGSIAMTDGVFTDRNHRNKRYAKFLMYRITEDLLREGFTPVLYADCRKAAPNKVYKSIGYEDCGKIIEYKFSSSK